MNLLESIEQAGIVGCGGAGFPTHVKFRDIHVDYLILNGAECEPLLRTDRYIMKNFAERIVTAAEEVSKLVHAKECHIALKRTYTDEIKALEKAISDRKSFVEIFMLDNFYPAGDEHAIVYEVSKRVVPSGGIPLDVGCVVSNIASMLCISDAMEGKPFIGKYLTITGEVKNPVIVHVPIGTSFDECIKLAGGALENDYFVVSGGPLMGVRMTKEEAAKAVVTKTTSGILILPKESKIAKDTYISLAHMYNRAKSACIQCSYCTELCPRYLLGHPIKPHKIMRRLALSGDLEGLLNDPEIQNAALCCECGVCEEYACPMQLQPRRVNVMLKDALRKAKIRYKKEDKTLIPNPEREGRKIPSKRVASRVGVQSWYDLKIDTLVEGSADYVEIPLNMHIGAPAEPVVKSRDKVTEGQLIAKCPDGTLGANIHASISGVVKDINTRIIIERDGQVLCQKP
jgi:Na+-translocating ferredoxin:NAD+ oxidoreductase RnfC subunit